MLSIEFQKDVTTCRKHFRKSVTLPHTCATEAHKAGPKGASGATVFQRFGAQAALSAAQLLDAEPGTVSAAGKTAATGVKFQLDPLGATIDILERISEALRNIGRIKGK